MKNKFLITIDGIRKDRVGCYNLQNKNLTPNLNRIAEKSIVFNDMMACATSTAMCFASLFVGKYQKYFKRKRYGDNNNPFNQNIFTDLEKRGYKTIICLNSRFKNCFNLINTIGKNTDVWWTGFDYKTNKSKGSLRPLEQVKYLNNKIKYIKKPIFIWCHLWGFSDPQSKFLKQTAIDYDARLLELDEAIGYIFDKHQKNSEFYFFSDHGYAFFEQAKWAYGKDGKNLVENVTAIPAIVYNGKNSGYNNNLVSQIQFRKIINNSSKALKIKDEVAFCESRYLYENDISLAVRHKQFKLVIEYNKIKKYLYDIKFDPYENLNLLSKSFFKLQRDKNGNHQELKPYIIRNDWKEINLIYKKLDMYAFRFYNFLEIPLDIKFKNFIKSTFFFHFYKKFLN